MWQPLPDTEEWTFMNRIQEAFQNKKAFIPFITGGDPSLEITERLLYAMEEAGADLIEIGIPFSDPTAEGVVIQKANERALEAGCTTDKLFDTIKRARKKVRVPMVFLTYVNPIYTYGKERFMKRCVECGIDGLIVPDMPFEGKRGAGSCVRRLWSGNHFSDCADLKGAHTENCRRGTGGTFTVFPLLVLRE